MKGLRSTTGSKSSVQMAQRFLWSKNPFKSFITYSGNLMKQVHCLGLTSISWEKRRARRVTRIRSQNESWSLVETVLFLRWCANRWLKEPLPIIRVQRKSTKICTKNLQRSKQLKLKCKFNHKRIHLAQVWFRRLRTRKCRAATKWRIQISIRSLEVVHLIRSAMTTLRIGEWANSTMMTITWRNRRRLRKTKATCFLASSKSRRNRLASMLLEERRRRQVR